MGKKLWYLSVTGEGLSASIGGFSLLGVAQALNFVLGTIGYSSDDNTIVNILILLINAFGGIYVAFGLVRKGIVKIGGYVSKTSA